MRVDNGKQGYCAKSGEWVADMSRCPMYYFNDYNPVCLNSCGSFIAAKPLAEVVYSADDGEIYDYYDEVETIEDCTVQILRNSKTGKESVGWWRNH